MAKSDLIKLLFEVQLPISIKKKGVIVVAGCPVLDVWTQGDTLKKAKNNLIEALRLFFITCYKKGTLKKVLKQCSASPHKRIYVKIIKEFV